jgi:hypothetical protein
VAQNYKLANGKEMLILRKDLLSRNLHGGTEENEEKPYNSSYTGRGLASCVQSKFVIHWTSKFSGMLCVRVMFMVRYIGHLQLTNESAYLLRNKLPVTKDHLNIAYL